MAEFELQQDVSEIGVDDQFHAEDEENGENSLINGLDEFDNYSIFPEITGNGEELHFQVDDYLRHLDGDYDTAPGIANGKPSQLGAIQGMEYNNRAKSEISDCGGKETIPRFVAALYNILNNPDNEDMISWEGEDGFIVHQPDKFCEELLLQLCNSKSFCSFIRQLNGYGFSKSDPKKIYFRHPIFRKGRPDLLKYIKRRKTTKRRSSPSVKSASETKSSLSVEETSMGAHMSEQKNGIANAVAPTSIVLPAVEALSNLIQRCRFQAKEISRLSKMEAAIHQEYLTSVHTTVHDFLCDAGIRIVPQDDTLESLTHMQYALKELKESLTSQGR